MKIIFASISWWCLNKGLTIVLLLTCGIVNSQSIPIKDDVLRQYFCDNYSDAMNAGCTLLDTGYLNSTYTTPQRIYLRDFGIKSADELVHFQAADTVFFWENQLTSFPRDLRHWFPTDRLMLSENQLTEVPFYLYNEQGEGIRLAYFAFNKIKSLPETWDTLNTSLLNVLTLNDNELTEIPDFNGLVDIRRLSLFNNYLDFEDLLPLKGNPKYGLIDTTFQLFPQKPFNLSFEKTKYELNETVKLTQEDKLGADYFLLLKNEKVIDSSQVGEFTIVFNSDNDFGIYSVKARSLEFPKEDDFLISKKYNINQLPTQKKDVLVFSPNGDGIADEILIEGEGEAVFLNGNGVEIRSQSLPYTWKGDNTSGQLLEPGLYVIQKANGDYVEVLISY